MHCSNFLIFLQKAKKVWGRILRDGGFWPNGPFSRVKINSGFNINQLLTILGALPPTLCQISKQQNFPSRVVYNSKLQLFRKILKIQGFLVQYLHQNRNDEKKCIRSSSRPLFRLFWGDGLLPFRSSMQLQNTRALSKLHKMI